MRPALPQGRGRDFSPRHFLCYSAFEIDRKKVDSSPYKKSFDFARLVDGGDVDDLFSALPFFGVIQLDVVG